MSRVVTTPPDAELLADGVKLGGWWHQTDDGRVFCDLCPRECHLKDGDRGFCFVRENRGGQMVLTTYGRSTGFCVDPIEKKPLNHFFPGTSVLSFGTAGCNLGCKFCQNWDISKSREVARLSELATPESIAAAAADLGCHSVAYTYNDPVIWAEYAIDTARACRAAGIKSVAVTAGYITPVARGPFFELMDAANVDLKAFSEEFYYKITYSHLKPVLDTLQWLKQETDVWFEITNLLIPQANDDPDELRRMCDWILEHVGDGVPVHFTAFHPDFRMQDRPRTPHETLLAAHSIARDQGIKFAYVGNVNDVANQSTYCPACGGMLIERNWYELGEYHLRENLCGHCGETIPGHFATRPGTWGRQRMPVQMSRYAQSLPLFQLGEASMSTTNPPSQPAAPPAAVTDFPELTKDQREQIHTAACEYLAAAITGAAPQLDDAELSGAAATTVMGAFVTAKRQGRLRGCCGTLGRPMPLGEAVRQAAARTAVDDVRMPPVQLVELPFLDIDVTLLVNFRLVESSGSERAKAVEIGRHGLQIQRGKNSGLLLPSVATEHEMDAEEFLRQVCRKAGLPSTAWQEPDTQLVTFEGDAIDGPFADSVIARHPAPPAGPFSANEVSQLVAFCAANIPALVAGATPNYYLPGGADGTVSGVILSLQLPQDQDPSHLAQVAMRPGLPLQTTLFKLSESAAAALRARGTRAVDGLQVGVTILTAPAMQGTVAEPDLRGIDPQRRAVSISEATRTSWVFNTAMTAEQLVAAAAEEAQVTMPAAAQLFSYEAVSSRSEVTVGNVPRPQAGATIRPAGQAGTFYPASAGELDKLIDQCLDHPDAKAEPWPAVMLPHAGLIYSGRIAGAGLKHVQLPKTAIVIGPKHTRLGVEWAVTPHETWELPTGQVAADPQLARELTEAIPELQLDAAAHAQEHAIEVELPLLARLAPDMKVVGIALGGGNLQRCRTFADGLARVIQAQDEPPLLIISSDMNHFATDAENRRLDELALTAMETLDAEQLLDTVRRHAISMCGVLPAVIVMETLKQLGQLSRCQRVAYGTSADTSGDVNRVVGYASVLLG